MNGRSHHHVERDSAGQDAQVVLKNAASAEEDGGKADTDGKALKQRVEPVQQPPALVVQLCLAEGEARN